jgi:2-(1,2-epoxy-1,2-dihydrophenyl)acetyl-CoA isomerase
MELVLLNPRLDAGAALEMGLITAVYPVDRFEAEVLAVARRLADGPTRAYGIAKDLLNQAVGGDRLDYHLDQEAEHLARISDGPDFAEGLEAFFGKRSARFEGR